MHTKIILLLIVFIGGCTSAGSPDDNLWNNQYQMNKNVQSLYQEQLYNDPLYYYNSGFDNLYFN